MKIDRKYLKELIQEQINKLASPDIPEEEDPSAAPKAIGAKTVTRAQHAKAELEKSKGIQKGAIVGDITNKERAILQDVENLLTAIAEKDDLIKYKGALQQVINVLRKRAGV